MFLRPALDNDVTHSVWPDTRLAQSVEHMTLDLGVLSSSPTLGVEITLKKYFFFKAKKKKKNVQRFPLLPLETGFGSGPRAT